jgi:uncharacterized membrane protein
MTSADVERMEQVLGRVLYIGSISSTALLVIGLLFSFWRPDGRPATFFLQGGLIVLMATPVARVVVSIVEYAANRDWLFVGLTMTVLVILLGSLFVAMTA